MLSELFVAIFEPNGFHAVKSRAMIEAMLRTLFDLARNLTSA